MVSQIVRCAPPSPSPALKTVTIKTVLPKLQMLAIGGPLLVSLLLTGGCRTPGDMFHNVVPVANAEQNVASVPTRVPSVGDPVASETPVVQGVAYRAELPLDRPPMPESLPPGETVYEVSDFDLADLEALAVRNNPAMGQAAARVDAANGNWWQVGLAPNPTIGYSGQQLGSSGLAEQQGVLIGQEFVTAKKLKLARDAAAWEVDRAEQELAATRLRVLTDVRVGFYEVLIAQRRHELATELVRISTMGVEAAQSLYDSNEVSKVDPLRARVEADKARMMLQTAAHQHVESWRQLTAVLGMPTMKIQRLSGELNPTGLNLSWDDTLRELLQDSPEIAAAVADVEAARWARERAYAERIPNIEVEAVIQDDRAIGSTNGNLNVSLPIPLWNRNQGRIQEAHAQLTAAEQAVDRVAMDLQTRLAAAFQRYQSARSQVVIYSREDGIINSVQRTLDLVRSGYEAGEIRELELLSAQRTYFQTNMAYLDALREQSVSVMEIRGLMLRGSLTQ